MAKTDLRVVKTRRNIQNTFISMLSEMELSRITISEICEKAEINRKTFYRHYNSISELIAELEDTIVSDFSKNLTHNNSISNVGEVIQGISAAINRQSDYFIRLMKHNPDIFGRGKIKAIMRRLITVSLKSGGTDLLTISTAAEYTASGIISVFSQWIERGCTDDLNALTELAVQMTSRALSFAEPTGREKTPEPGDPDYPF